MISAADFLAFSKRVSRWMYPSACSSTSTWRKWQELRTEIILKTVTFHRHSAWFQWLKEGLLSLQRNWEDLRGGDANALVWRGNQNKFEKRNSSDILSGVCRCWIDATVKIAQKHDALLMVVFSPVFRGDTWTGPSSPYSTPAWSSSPLWWSTCSTDSSLSAWQQ